MYPTLSYKSIPNSELANYLNLTEGAVRAQKKADNKDKYLENLNKYIFNNLPYLTVDQYAENTNHSLSKLNKKIDDNKIPNTVISKVDKQKNKIENRAVPYNLNEIEDLKEEYKEFKTPNVLSFANTSGGAAKTTNAINVATALAQYGFDVLFVDFDTQSNASQRFGLMPELNFKHSIVDLIIEVGQSTSGCKELVEKSIKPLKEQIGTFGKFDVLPNSGKYENVNELTHIEEKLRLYGTAYQSLNMTIDLVKNNYDFVIIDTPPSISTPMTIIAMATDYFLLSYRPEDKAYTGVPMLVSKLKNEIEPVYKINKKQPIKIIGGIIGDYDGKINIQADNADIIITDFLENNKRFDGNSNWNVFNERIKKLTKFEDIKVDSYGTLFSKKALEDPIDYNVAKTIRDYMSIATQIVERIVIDKYETEGK